MNKICCLLFLLLFLLPQCQPIDDRKPPDSEDVFAVRDSIREAMLLRLGEAMQEINRQTEKKRRKAYSVPPREAKQLREQAEYLEGQYQRLSRRAQRLKQDSVLGQWYQELNQLEVQLLDLSQTMGVSL